MLPMKSLQFKRDRYDPRELLGAIDCAELRSNSDGETYLIFDLGYDFEIYFPSCDSPPIPDELMNFARLACENIRDLDNAVQANLENDAEKSEHDSRNFMLHIGYLSVLPDRLQIRYWGEIVNTEWEAEFKWSAGKLSWEPLNF